MRDPIDQMPHPIERLRHLIDWMRRRIDAMRHPIDQMPHPIEQMPHPIDAMRHRIGLFGRARAGQRPNRRSYWNRHRCIFIPIAASGVIRGLPMEFAWENLGGASRSRDRGGWLGIREPRYANRTVEER
jgi:hypothetical protein